LVVQSNNVNVNSVAFVTLHVECIAVWEGEQGL